MKPSSAHLQRSWRDVRSAFAATTWFALIACSSSSDNDLFDDSPTGGKSATASGGAPSQGGTSSAEGGSKATGGTAVAGNATASGGSEATTGGSDGTSGGTTQGDAGEPGEMGGAPIAGAGEPSGGVPAEGGTGATGTGGQIQGGSIEPGTGGSAGTVTGSGGSAEGGGGASDGGGGTSDGGGGVGGEAGAPCAVEPERCDGEDNDCNDLADDGAACPEDCVGATYGEHAYVFCDGTADNVAPDGQRDWDQAMEYCLDREQVLVALETEPEANFVYGMLTDLEVSSDGWMGATDRGTAQEGTWSWAAGTELADGRVPFYSDLLGEPVGDFFIDWHDGEPNDEGGEDCGLLQSRVEAVWGWDDRSCEDELSLLICEDPP